MLKILIYIDLTKKHYEICTFYYTSSKDKILFLTLFLLGRENEIDSSCFIVFQEFIEGRKMGLLTCSSFVCRTNVTQAFKYPQYFYEELAV